MPNEKKLRWAMTSALIVIGSLIVAAFLAFVIVLPEPDLDEIPAHLVLPRGADAWDAGRKAHDAGELEEAVAYWKQVSEDHPEYARSLRYIGWEVYAGERDEPRKALPYVHRCVLEAPFDGNTWQDLARTYAAVLGLNDRGSPPRAVHSTSP
jgi:hypothetical protein